NLGGEISIYLFILTLFLSRGINLKVGYIVQVFFVLKLIFDRKNITLKGKEIYKVFGIILLLGILMNLFISEKNGWELFFNQNIKFIFGMAFLLFIDSKEKLEKTFVLLVLGSSILSISKISNLNFIDYSHSRTRPLIMMGAVFSSIYLFENIKKSVLEKKNNMKILYVVPAVITALGIMYSDSRMGFLVYLIVLFLYTTYNIFYYKMKLRKIGILLLLTSLISVGIYKTMPTKFVAKVKTSFQTKRNFSNEARLVMWNGGFKAFKSKPLTGVGSTKYDTQPFNIEAAKEYGDKYNANYLKNAFVERKQFTEHHSIYVNFLSQNGLLITLLFLYLFFIQTSKRLIASNKNSDAIASYFTLLSFLIYGITWSVWTLYSVAQMLFQLFLAILIYSTNKEE
ncbi:MAG: O-antigen ligase family protein, partial [Cetobacterium sp.]